MDYLKTQAPFWKKEAHARRRALGRCARAPTTPRWRAGASPAGNAAPRRRAAPLSAPVLGLAGRGGRARRRRRRAAALARRALAERALARLSARHAARQLRRRPAGRRRAGLVRARARTSCCACSLVTGFLGGFTTFSAFSVESLILLQRGDWVLAAAHTLAHVLGALACAALGFRLARWLLADAESTAGARAAA